MSSLNAELLQRIAGAPLATVLGSARSGRASEPIDIADATRRACELAKHIQQRAVELQTPAERRQQAELDRMLQHPEDKVTLTQMTDQGFRSRSPDRAVDQLIHILDVQGIPRFFSQLDRALLRGFQSFGNYLPGVAVPMVKEKMRKETSNVILPAQTELLREHLEARRREGIRMNVNFLGEAILGEREAQHRLERYLAALQQPEIEVVSVKISTLYSQISPLARSHTLSILCDRLEMLYRAAARYRFQSASPSGVQEDLQKFVYLDMEEYRDMALTSAAFMSTLDRPGLEQVRAGIALQAYIPDSFLVQQQITQWAQTRLARGGGPITIRIVKGANMEMERLEASLRGWPQAPYKTKLETDANYKRMLLYGMQPKNITAVHLGVASHNLFEVALALIVAVRLGVLSNIQFEMLEGMANHQRRALCELCQSMLLYAPACTDEDFTSAIGYLVRRLDENTGPDNFLRHAFKITVDSPAWNSLAEQFRQAAQLSDSVSSLPRRTQDRRAVAETSASTVRTETDICTVEETLAKETKAVDCRREFVNEPDTDFSLPQNGLWAESIITSWQSRCDQQATGIPLAIDGRDEEGRGELFESRDPSRPGVIVARYRQADPMQLRRAIEVAQADRDQWLTTTPAERYRVLHRVAVRIAERRADLIGAALADGGKTILESDPEVSEAIDFVEFYGRCGLSERTDEPAALQRRVVVVISPWNFPIAIPCGGIAAALAAGNTVILKPASDTVLPARILCECFWEAGISRSTLQLIACSGRTANQELIGDPGVGSVILTGGTSTAMQMLSAHPNLRLFAETGGKNATIVSSLSDHDLAIKNVLHSAFSHSGQKCSATSLLLLEEEVYNDARFRQTLVDSIESMTVGSAWDLPTKIGPLIRPPSDDLLRGLKELEEGETWAVMPRKLDANPCLYSPALKWDVKPGGFTHRTELFGPVLGVIPYRHLSDAIQIVHQTGYGLTSGLESLDDREQQLWSSRLRAGNLYINRPTTGAIVLRQPFGGFGKSSFGPGIKAGGPNYILPLMIDSGLGMSIAQSIDPALVEAMSEPLRDLWDQLHDQEDACAIALREHFSDDQWATLEHMLVDYDRYARAEIAREHDWHRLIGQDNLRRYLPLTHLRIRVTALDRPIDILARVLAARAVGGRAVVSAPTGVYTNLLDQLEELTHVWGAAIEFMEESDQQLIKAIGRGQVDRLRYSLPTHVPLEVRQAANQNLVYIADSPISTSGRRELIWYVQEQSLSLDYHRYGNLGARAAEQRYAPL